MPAAATLTEARNFSAQNLWTKFLAVNSIRNAFVSWKDNGLSELSPSIKDQAETRNWLVPTSLLIQDLPSVAADQVAEEVAQSIEILYRTIDRIINTTLTAPQTAAILAAYNAAFA